MFTKQFKISIFNFQLDTVYHNDIKFSMIYYGYYTIFSILSTNRFCTKAPMLKPYYKFTKSISYNNKSICFKYMFISLYNANSQSL